MKTAQTIRDIGKAARARGITFEVVRSSGKHDIWRLGATVQIPIPRHAEIGPKMEFEIRKQCEPELGPRWWR
jgi:hypothetical protein